jgi:hypothetical protein
MESPHAMRWGWAWLLILSSVLGAGPAAAATFELVDWVDAGDLWASAILGAPSWDGSALAWMERETNAMGPTPISIARLRLRPAGQAGGVVTASSQTGSGIEFAVSGFSLSGGMVVWRVQGTGPLAETYAVVGLHRGDLDESEQLVSHESPFPPPDLPYFSAGPPRARAGRVAFAGVRHDGEEDRKPGVFVWESGVITELPLPPDSFPAGLLDYEPVSLGGESAAFVSYRWEAEVLDQRLHHVQLAPGAPGDVETWAQSGDPLPDGALLHGIATPQLDRSRGDAACFHGTSDGAATGVFVATAAGVERIADESMPIPGGSGVFESFDSGCSMDDGRVVFVGRGGDDQVGIYLGSPGGPLVRVLDRSSVLEGMAVRDLSLDAEGFSDGRLAFAAELEAAPGEELAAIRYAVFVPEPEAGFLAAAASLACLHGRRSRRGRRPARSASARPKPGIPFGVDTLP